MDSNNEMLDNYSFSKEGQLIQKIESIDVDFLRKEEIEENCHVDPGKMLSFKVEKVSVNKQLCKNEETENSSISKV